MSIETALLLTSTTALQGWFEARGASLRKGGEDTLEISEGIFHPSPELGELTTMAGRLLSTMPYIACPQIKNIFISAISNPYWIGAGLLALNIVPSVIYAMSEDKDSTTARMAMMASQIMGVAMKVLNLIVIGSVLSANAIPLTVPIIAAVTVFGALSTASLIYTTTQSLFSHTEEF